MKVRNLTKTPYFEVLLNKVEGLVNAKVYKAFNEPLFWFWFLTYATTKSRPAPNKEALPIANADTEFQCFGNITADPEPNTTQRL